MPLLRRSLLLCLVVTLLACLTGCNVVAMKQAGIERTLRAAGLEAREERLGGDTVHYWSGGHGPAVVLVHGFGGSATWLWYPQVEDLAKDHTVILPDLLWFGDSPSGEGEFSMDDEVVATAATLRRLAVRWARGR